MNQVRTRSLLPMLVPLLLSLGACGQASAPNEDTSSFATNPDATGGMPSANDMNSNAGQAYEQAAPLNDAGALPASSDGMQRVALIDRNGFERPMPALTLDLPVGWSMQGGVTWNGEGRCASSPRYEMRASSPDGTQAVEILPAEAWQFSNLPTMGIDMPCANWRIDNVRDYLQSLVQRKRPGARILDYRPRPELITFQPPPSTGQDRYWKESGEMLIAYSLNGAEVREDIGTTVTFHRTVLPGMGPGDERIFIDGISSPALTVRAPEGKLDMSLLGRIHQSSRPDPQWQARMDQHNTQLARQGLKGQIARGQDSYRTSQDVADINQRTWQAGQDSSDGIQRATVDSINNVQRYQDPTTGGEVQLDNRYDHAYRTGDGTTIQSNDPNLNQQGALGADAEELERSR